MILETNKIYLNSYDNKYVNLRTHSCEANGVKIILGFIVIKIKTSNILSNIKKWVSRKN